MATVSSTQRLSQLLRQPQALTPADESRIQQLVGNYPYFVPARYLAAAATHKQQPYQRAMMANMQLYMGNWLHFCQFMTEALGTSADLPAQAATVVEEPAEDTLELWEEAQETVHEAIPVHDTAAEIHHIVEQIDINDDNITAQQEEHLITPIFTEDYFLHQGIPVSNDLPKDIDVAHYDDENADGDEDKSLMVMMSFSEWLLHFKKRKDQEKEEQEDKKALRSMWQKEKLAAALEEENDEIPENVFEMAVNSIAREDNLASEALAEIYAKQGKYDTAIDMYRKLSLRNPQKNTYFAAKIEALLKEK